MAESCEPTVTRESCALHGAFEGKSIVLLGKVRKFAVCPSCAKISAEENTAKEAKLAAEAKQRRIEARLNEAGIPLRYRSKYFSSYIADTEGKQHALAVATDFADRFDSHHLANGTVAVFSGMPGTGKSHLAIAIAQAVMRSSTALYTSAIDAVRLIRDTWRRDSPRSEIEVLKTLASIDLLILDEVGVQYGTEAEQVALFDIIDKRYRDMRPMILLTNLNKSGMKTFLGDRSFDRLREGGVWVTFDWSSQRGNV